MNRTTKLLAISILLLLSLTSVSYSLAPEQNEETLIAMAIQAQKRLAQQKIEIDKYIPCVKKQGTFSLFSEEVRLNEKERQKHIAYSYDNKLYWEDGEEVDSRGSQFLYVMDKYGIFYICNKFHLDLEPGCDFFHSSFLSGAEVSCAGLIECEDGLIMFIDNCSGHYRPEFKHMNQMVNHMQKLGIQFNEISVSIDMNNKDKFKHLKCSSPTKTSA